MTTKPVRAEVAPESTATLLEMVGAGWTAQMLAVVAKLGIADLLADGHRRADELAEACGANAAALDRVLRALVSVGVFVESDGGYALAPVGDALRSDAPASVRALVVMCGEPWYQAAWAHLLYSVRTGDSAFERIHECDLFEYLSRRDEAAAWYHDAMTDLSTLDAASVPEFYDFSRFESVVDVGGGHGTQIVEILRANPRLRGTVFDAPYVVVGARAAVRRAGLADRCTLVGGDLFRAVPDGADIYMLSRVLRDCDDERARRVLKNCRRAMARDGRVVLLEVVRDDEHALGVGPLFDVERLVISSNGRERTASEYRELLRSAGLDLQRIVPLPSDYSILEAM